MHQRFMKSAAYAIMLLAVFNMNNAIALTGSNLTLNNVWTNVYCTISFCKKEVGSTRAQATTPVANTTINIENEGYTPNDITVKAGSQVKINLVNNGGSGCTQAFTIPKLGIQKVVPLGSSDTIAFTAPREAGPLAFMCSMGMFRGVIHVI